MKKYLLLFVFLQFLTIYVNGQNTSYQTISSCDSLTYKGTVFKSSTFWRDTIKAINGIDSIYNVTIISISPSIDLSLTIKSDTSFICSGSGKIKFSVTSNIPAPIVTPPSSGTLFIVGDATQGSWNNPVPTPSQQFYRKDSLTYEGVFYLNGSGHFLLLPKNGSLSTSYAVSNNTTDLGIASGKGGKFTILNGTTNQNLIPIPNEAGWYSIIVDFQHGVYTIAPYTSVFPTNLFIIGSATNGGWDNPVPVPSQEFTQLDACNFTITLPLIGSQSYLFLPVNGDWFQTYRPDTYQSPFNGTFGYNASSNFNSPDTSGNYRINANFFSNQYTVTPDSINYIDTTSRLSIHYQWLKNSVKVGKDTCIYTDSITYKDVIQCVVQTNLSCSVPVVVTSAATLKPVTKTLTLTDCNNVNYNGKTYKSSTKLCDTLRSYKGCDSLYNVVNIVVSNTLNSWNYLGDTILHTNYSSDVVITDDSGNIYVAGDFTNSSGNNYVAKWTKATNKWSELGGSNSCPANSLIYTICLDKDYNVYIAGGFNDNNQNAYVLKWNKSTNQWSLPIRLPPSSLIGNFITKIKTDNSGNLYVVGIFLNSHNNNYVAVLNNVTNQWSELGGDNSLKPNTNINSMCIDSFGNVYVAGTFTNKSGNSYVAIWDKTTNQWSELGGDNSLKANGGIYRINLDKYGNLYGIGWFKNNSGNLYVAQWNKASNQWIELGGKNSLPYTIAYNPIFSDTNGNLYVYIWDTLNYAYIAKWNKSNNLWTKLTYADTNLYKLNSYNNDMIVDENDNIFLAGYIRDNYGDVPILKYTPNKENTINLNGCSPFLYKGKYYTNSTIVYDTVLNYKGCDSIFSTVNIVVGNNGISGNIIHPKTKSGINFLNPVNVNLTGKNSQSLLSEQGYSFNCLSDSTKGIIRLSKNNDINKANGVTAVDIALTQANILGKNMLNSPYKLIAADVNGDAKVTALDIVYMKRLILGIDTTFTNSVSKQTRLWAFVDSSYKFPDSTNPFPFKDSISYSGLSASKTNQTFIGCKLGDVNWDWNPAVARPVVDNTNAIELSYPSVRPGRASDGYIHIPVMVKNFKDMLGMQFTIRFDPTVLQWQGLGNNPLGIETGTNHAGEGSISFLWVDPKNEIKTLDDGSVLFNLVFEKSGDCINEQLSLDGSITSVVAYDKDYQSHNVVFKPSVINSMETKDIWTIAPNPTKDGVIKVQMNLRDNKTVVFRLSDITGRLLLMKQVEGIKGINNITLKEGNIASGTYYLQAVGVEGVKQLRIEN